MNLANVTLFYKFCYGCWNLNFPIYNKEKDRAADVTNVSEHNSLIPLKKQCVCGGEVDIATN